jgi:hypothetical protein
MTVDEQIGRLAVPLLRNLKSAEVLKVCARVRYGVCKKTFFDTLQWKQEVLIVTRISPLCIQRHEGEETVMLHCREM